MTSGPQKPIAPASLPPANLSPKQGRWTDDQWRGITETGKSLLVSAAAGSGKTAVLAERCAYLVCNANPCCGVDELLVVTFTEPAAVEMKTRIEQVLRERLSREQTPRLAHQLALVDHAQISTLHAFCSRVLRQHFHLVGIDPNFSILDGDESALLRLEICRELFHHQYENDADGSFQRLVDVYADGDDERLVQRIVCTHELLCSLVDPDGWRNAARDRIVEAIELPLEKSQMGKELAALLRRHLSELLARIHAAAETIKTLQHFPKYIDDLRDLYRMLNHWTEVLDEHGVDALAEESQVELPRLPSISNALPHKDLAKNLMDGIRNEIKEGMLTEVLRFSSQQWKDGLRQILPAVQTYLGLVEQFADRYTDAKAQTRSLDFNDLERLALRVLCEGNVPALRPSAVAAGYQRQFQHVLVDEYQDINEVQDAILSLVSREGRSDEATERRSDEGNRSADRSQVPNFFCVGDVKQSIYRFRLAEPGRFIKRQDRFRRDGVGGAVIDLQANFRSRAPLLEAINEVFRRLLTRDAGEFDYDSAQELRPGLTYPPGDGVGFVGAPIELHLLPSKSDAETNPELDQDDAEDFDRTENEARLVAQRIHELLGHADKPRRTVMEKSPAGELQPRPIRYGDIVLLLRSMQYKADQFAEVLRRSGIPVHAASATGYFESTEVRDMLALLRLLDNARQDIPMAAVLRSPLVGLACAEDCLGRIRLAYRTVGEQPVPFHQAVVRYADEQNDELAARLRDFLADLRRWRELAHQRPLAEVIWTIYDETGYLAFCAGLEDGEQRSANLLYLHERARQFGTFHRQGLARFMQFLQSLQDESDLGQPSIASEADDVVRIMSIHKSKGLEFPIVFLPDLGKAINLSDCRGPVLADREAFLALPVVDEVKRIRYPSLASLLVGTRIRRQSMAEELRVLYVAMTRAREHLILVGTCAASTVEKWDTRWSRHQGAIPGGEVQRARCMLEWIGPIDAITRGAGAPVFERIEHTAEEIDGWATPAGMRPKMDETQQRLARLEPIAPPPAPDDGARQVIDRLTYRYPHAALTQVPATLSVTGWTKRQDQGSTVSVPAAGSDGLLTTKQPLPLPSFLSDAAAVSPLDAGSATHLVLQHLDFARPCDEADVRGQMDQMVARRLISAAHGAAVEVEAICWLMRGGIGQLLRQNAKQLRRELPLYFPAPPTLIDPAIQSDGPADAIMIRGRIDVLIPTSEGLFIVDYKTDRIPAEMLPARVETYRPQVQMYRQAIERITGRRVAQVHLAFLSARKVQTM